MCGIVGFLILNGTQPQEEMIIKAADALRHRGPDDFGYYISKPVALGHRRLSIIDLSQSGRQPIPNEDETIWLTYNGEIYNFLEIKKDLEKKGHRFRSLTDSEVIVHAYEEWGYDCIERFNGMFAFGLWDGRSQKLWIVRDRLGIKPLFYLHSREFFAFGSEIKALLEIPGLERQIDFQALSYFLALNYTPAPYTLFKGIRQLEPGHSLIVDVSGFVQDDQYWELRYNEENTSSEKEYQDEFLCLLEDSVRIRLVSDVPFGAFLSGGIDSSTVAYWMSQNLNEAVKTFSIGFNENSFDETSYARQVAKSIHSDHYERLVDADAASILPRLVWHSEEPTADSSMVAVYYLSQMTREHVTMALSGDGADEILAGYETYQAYYLHSLYKFLPPWLRKKVIIPLVDLFFPPSDKKVSFDFKLKRFVRSGDYSSEDAHAMWRMIFDQTERHQLLAPINDCSGAQADVIDLYRKYFALSNANHPLNRMSFVDTRFYLPNDMLVKVDRMSMAHGLEVRVPFLDYRLVEFLANVPANLKLRNFVQKKYLLKAAMTGKIPGSILGRKKAGFNLPNATWLKKELKPFVLDHLSKERIQETGILEYNVVSKLLADHFNNRMDYSHHIWCLLTFVLWWEKFIFGDRNA